MPTCRCNDIGRPFLQNCITVGVKSLALEGKKETNHNVHDKSIAESDAYVACSLSWTRGVRDNIV
jgi:hypothetical protein